MFSNGKKLNPGGKIWAAIGAAIGGQSLAIWGDFSLPPTSWGAGTRRPPDPLLFIEGGDVLYSNLSCSCPQLYSKAIDFDELGFISA